MPPLHPCSTQGLPITWGLGISLTTNTHRDSSPSGAESQAVGGHISAAQEEPCCLVLPLESFLSELGLFLLPEVPDPLRPAMKSLSSLSRHIPAHLADVSPSLSLTENMPAQALNPRSEVPNPVFQAP